MQSVSPLFPSNAANQTSGRETHADEPAAPSLSRSPTPLRDGVKRDTTVSVASISGKTEVHTDYNPGGVIPEVEQRPTGVLFGFIFAVLVILLILPSIVGRVRARASGPGGAAQKSKAKGRVRLTGDPSGSGKKKRR